MSTQAETTSDIAAVLDRHQEEIYTAWAGMIHRLSESHHRERPLEELHVLAMRGLEAVIEVLDTGSYVALETYVTNFSHARLQVGFDIAEVIEELFLFKETIMSVVRRIAPPGSITVLETCAQLDTCLRRAVGYLARQHAAETSRRLRERQERTATLLEIVRAAASTLELDEVLRRVAQAINTVVGTPHCGFCLVDEERGLLIPQEASMSGYSLSGSFSSPPIPPLPLSTLDAFERHILEHQEPTVCYDTETDPRVIRELTRLRGIKSILAVPFAVKGRMVAIAFACTYDEYRDFTEEQEQVDLAWSIANAVALAIENARLYQRAEQLAVVEERARIAHDLHDDSNQLIVGALYEIQAAQQMFRRGCTEAVPEKLDAARGILRQIAAKNRLIIAGLRPPVLKARGLLPAIRWYADTFQECYQLACTVKISGCLIRLAPEVETAVYRIVQEALNNVTTHAGASRVRIQVHIEPAALRLVIQDDGQGFDPQCMEAESPGHFGLTGMRERAQSIGGTIAIQSAPGQGTSVTLQVPLPEKRGSE